MGGELVNGRGIDGGKPILIYINVLAGKPDLNFDELKEHMDEVFKETYGMLSGKISYSACKE